MLVLEWIGFVDAVQRTCITDNTFQTFAYVLVMNTEDVTELSTFFSCRIATNGKIDFSIRRTKEVTHFLQWVHNAARTLYTAMTNGYVHASLLSALTDAGERADFCRQLRDKYDVKAKEALPGPLVSENKCTYWEPMVVNYLTTMLGMNSVPLSYVIRDNDEPDRTSTFPDFSE